MGEITKGQQIRITTPLTVTRIGTADLEVEYPAGPINLKLNIPKKICEPILVTEIMAGGQIAPDDYKTHIDLASQIKPEYKCDICGKICTARIGLAGHKRSHKLKSPVVST